MWPVAPVVAAQITTTVATTVMHTLSDQATRSRGSRPPEQEGRRAPTAHSGANSQPNRKRGSW